MDIALCLDSTLPGLALSLANPERTLWKLVLAEQQQHSHMLSQHIATGLASINKNLDDVDAVVVAVGPGSFTGIKVSLAYVYGLVETGMTRRPSLGVSTLELLAQDYSKQFSSPVALCLRSTRTAGYICLIDPLREPKTYVLQVADDARMIYSDQEIIAADAAQTAKILSHYKVLTLGSWPEASQVIKPGILEVKVDQALDLGLELMQAQFKKEWPRGFLAEIPQPRYLRPSSPEEKLLLTNLRSQS